MEPQPRIMFRISRIKSDYPALPLPTYATEGSSGMDLCASIGNETVLAPGDRALIPTGIRVEIPNGFEAQVRPRSGLAIKHGVTVLNTPGTIDSDYRGEIKVILANFSTEDYIIRRGERIAQLVIAPVVKIGWIEVEEVNESKRGDGGFGHTGQ